MLLKNLKSGMKLFVRLLHGSGKLDASSCGVCKIEKVAICGAGGKMGQILALLLKQSDAVREIHLHDNCNVHGIALDLDHIDTPVRVKPNSGKTAIKNALRHATVVVIADGYDLALECSDEQCLQINGPLLYYYAGKIASICPGALICILSPPINSLVPLFSEAMKKCRAYDPNKIFGVCSLFEMRSNAITGDYLVLDPALMHVPMIGGVSPATSVPLFSHARPYNGFSEDDEHAMATNILEVPKECKKLHTTAPLSTAYAALRFVLTLVAGMNNCDYAKQTAYVRSDVMPQVKYFASTLKFGAKGAVLNYGLPKLNAYELDMLENALPALEKDIERGLCLYDCLKQEPQDFEGPKKPFITKTPVPPCAATCLPAEVCVPRKPPNPCSAIR